MLLVVAMLLSFTGTVAYAAEGDLTFTVGTASVDVSGETKDVKVPVSLSNNTNGVTGAGLALEYDTTALTFTGVTMTSTMTSTVNTEKGIVILSSGTGKNYTGNGEIMQLNFTVTDAAKNGDYSITMKVRNNDLVGRVDDNGDTVEVTDVTFNAGTITVSGVAAQSQVTSLVLKKANTDTDLTELKLSISKVGTVYSSSVRAEFEAEEGPTPPSPGKAATKMWPLWRTR